MLACWDKYIRNTGIRNTGMLECWDAGIRIEEMLACWDAGIRIEEMLACWDVYPVKPSEIRYAKTSSISQGKQRKAFLRSRASLGLG
jgi:uncharacterized protein (DUF433 family)